MIFPAEYDIQSTVHASKQSLILRATGKTNQRPVIIKTFNSEYPTFEEIAKLRHEFSMLSLIDHPAVIKPIEMRNDRMVLVLEDIGGTSLHNIIQQDTMPLDRFFPIAIQLADGLAIIHQKRIIHKDCNPSNIIINEKTDEVRYIDFGMSTLLTEDTLSVQPDMMFEGTWDYISPEQTGRISRSIDFRSDLYSLGICFYEMLTGKLPFQTDDHLEKIHSHIARDIESLPHVSAKGNEMLLAIIRKLTAKTPEARYHSAKGLKHDLERCWQEWQKTGRITLFTLGENDVSFHFLIPDKNYGRETELAVLKDTFQKVKSGNREIVFVTAPPGYGKTAIIREVKSDIIREKGLYIAGKADRYKDAIPYAPLSEAIRDLVQQSLTLDKKRLASMKMKLGKALGANGQVILEIAPELEAIIGKQPPILDLGPRESQNRFNIVFQKFIDVFTSENHPLTLFLDDLQWCDKPTLSFLKTLLTSYKNRCLLVICAYRNSEMDDNHPLLAAISEIETGNTITKIELNPWEVANLQELVSDTLQQNGDETDILAKAIFEKTAGNPLHSIEFFKTLYTKKHIQFNYSQNKWEWDLKKVTESEVSADNIDFITNRILNLDVESRRLLMHAACIGPLFELSVLSMVSGLTLKETLSHLRPAIREGIITAGGRSYHSVIVEEEIDSKHKHHVFYQFTHDRIQQVYYQMIPEEDREALHLKIGRYHLRFENDLRNSGKLFFVLNQLNQAVNLISDPKERMDLAVLNLIAGKKAKASNAFQSALFYLENGVNLLNDSHWETDFELIRDLCLEKAETEYQVGGFGQAMINFDMLIKKTESILDQVAIRRRKIVLYTNYGEYESAVKEGVLCLQLLGMDFPQDENELLTAIQNELKQFKVLLQNRKIPELQDLPSLTDERIISIMSILINLDAPAYFYNPRILALVLIRIVNLSLKHGNCDVSALGYASFSGIIGGQLGDFESAFEFGQLGAKLNNQYENIKLFTKVSMSRGAFANHWGQHLDSSIAIMKNGYKVGVEHGDLVNASFCLGGMIRHLQAVGQNLEEYKKQAIECLQFVERAKFFDQFFYYEIAQRYAMSLQGLTLGIGDFSDDSFDEGKYRGTLERSTNKAAQHWYYVLKSLLFYLAGNTNQAYVFVDKAESLKAASMGQIQLAEHYWVKALVLAAKYSGEDKERQAELLASLQEVKAKLNHWAALCPENYLHKSQLVDAKLAEISGQILEAGNLYDDAIESAAEHRFIHCEAIINEETAKFYLNRGNEKIARVYFLEARNGYLNWGAIAKVQDLDTRFEDLLAKARKYYIQVPGSNSGKPVFSMSQSESRAIDLDSIIKASTILSSELVLDKLLKKLMKIVLENAGAQHGFLILKQKEKMVIEATGSIDDHHVDIDLKEEIDLAALDSEQSKLPLSVINYVIHTRKPVVLTLPEGYDNFSNDVYLDKKRPKSAVCVPLLHQDNLVGLWYLENNLVTGAFSEDRLKTIHLLSTEMAISIENAKLYQDLSETAQKLEETNATLEHKVKERTEELYAKNKVLNKALKEMEKAKDVAETANKAKSQFLANISHELRTPMHGILGFAKLGQSKARRVDINKVVSYFDSILSSGERLLALLNDLLDLSKLESGRMEYEFTRHSFSDILNAAVKELTPVIEEKKITLSIPKPDFDDSIDLDFDKILQVLVNLVSNAVKFSETGGRIQFSIIDNFNQILFFVKDEGVGVPQQELSEIFSHFFQSTYTSDGAGGTGLGLAISKRIIIDHYGQIWAENNEDKGITVKLQIPKIRT
ncbi:MAG: AAA family ATPase [Proteobacteria bacterium]|nr:AAA family ATPase [Pseudomonadota bacterium]